MFVFPVMLFVTVIVHFFLTYPQGRRSAVFALAFKSSVITLQRKHLAFSGPVILEQFHTLNSFALESRPCVHQPRSSFGIEFKVVPRKGQQLERILLKVFISMFSH